MVAKVALATCTKLPEPDVDEALLVRALEERGASVRLLAWDDPLQEPSPDELVVIRSTWNYYRCIDAFSAWVARVDETTRLLNPASIVQANTHKTYLRDLERRGVAIVPTDFVAKGEARDVARVTYDGGWPSVVIKPAVSAASFQTRRFAGAQVSQASQASQVKEAQRFFEELGAERDVLIQRWMPSTETYGERSMVWIDGELTHAVRKSPRFSGGSESVTAVPIAPDERAFAETVLRPIEDQLLYARVDIVRDEDGALRLMELELIEPSLFLREHPPALERLSRAIVRHAEARGTHREPGTGALA